jgi:predicted small lipoprotein YifL
MVLHLACRGYGIGLDLPATTNDVAAAIYNLTEGFENEPVQISISGVSSPIPNLYPYIQHADPENTADIQKLNTLAEQIGNMTLEEQRLFSGALELECTGGLDDAIRIAGGLERYEIFPKIVADADLGRFLVDTAFMTGRFSFPEEIKPYLDYAKIGAEQRDTLGGMYTLHGMVRRREEVPVQAETPRAMLLTLTASGQKYPLVLPASEKQLDHAKRALGIEDFSQAAISSVEYVAPYLTRLIPTDCVSVENANEMAHCLQQIKTDGEMMKYCAALEVEEPSTFTEALDMAIDIDDYELVPENSEEYGKQVLRRIGADDEIIDTIDGYMDFAQLGTDSLVEDGARQTGYGLVCRLSMPFPPMPEIGQTMM